MSDATLEHWFDRAVEDRLNDIINKYRQQGKDVHHVGGLRQRVAADLNALRGTAEWAKMRLRYDPPPKNRLAWCCVCDKPVTSGAVSAWLEDKGGNIYCSQQCRDNTEKHPITFTEFKQRMKDRGSMTTRRKEIIGGEVVLGDEFTITYDDIKHIGNPLPDVEHKPLVRVESADVDIIWTDD